ncbi:MAG: hypothetical protein NT166_09115 [Candidatus Aminicenantes bacterium]|nr:hypothetical protein [Candidatus Aminicenantes bacterium]
MVKKNIFYLTIILSLTSRVLCFSDEIAYGEKLNLLIENEELTVIHYHDWSKDSYEKRYKMITTHQDPFLNDNDYSYLECRDKKTGRQIFKKPVPALTKIHISNDSNYIIGLSKIKLDNPFQLVIFDKHGNLICKKHIAATESVLTLSEFHDFQKKFPALYKFMMSRKMIVIETDKVYLDYLGCGIQTGITRDTFKFLFSKEAGNHLSEGFSDSVTNHIYWYKEPDPKIKLKYNCQELIAISLLDPKGKRFMIPIKQCQE